MSSSRPGGVLLAVGGLWLACQLVGGNLLQRLGLLTTAAPSTSGIAGGSASGSQEPPAAPDQGGKGVPIQP